MFKNKIKLTLSILSYSFFTFIIIICVNAVVPEKNLPILEQKSEIVQEVENEFSRNKNSVYEILETNEQSKINNISSQSSSDKDTTYSVSENINSPKDQIFKLQFASFRDKKKSLNVSSNLQKNLFKVSSSIELIVKKVDISKEQTFFRVLSKNNYSFKNANNECNKLLERKIKCIIIKDK